MICYPEVTVLFFHLVAESQINRSLAVANGAPALNGKWIGKDSNLRYSHQYDVSRSRATINPLCKDWQAGDIDAPHIGCFTCRHSVPNIMRSTCQPIISKG